MSAPTVRPGRRRVLVIGAGKRVEETVLPALMCLQGSIEIAGVVARSSRKISFYEGEFTAQTETSPEAFDLATIDTIVVAVTRSQVPAVIRSLARFDTHHVSLMLDTPVLDPGGFGAMKMFPRFRRVVCSEDAIALPPIAAARALIDEGAIGDVRGIWLFHSGWRNHALASIRSMIGMRRPSRITVRRWNEKWSETRFRFAGGVRATVVQPHIHGHGKMLVVGDRGAIADYDTERGESRRIGYVVEDGVYRGSTIDGKLVASERDELLFANLPRAGLPRPTIDNMFKIRGFMELVASLGEDRPALTYDPFEAIYDHQSLRVAERVGTFVDPATGSRSLFGLGLGLAARLRRSGTGR